MVNDPLTCLIKPVMPCAFWGAAFTGISVYQGLPKQLAPNSFSRNFAFLYLYHSLQCPLEALSGRRSYLHNFLVGGTLGYMGVVKRVIGVPFVDQSFYMKYRQLTPAIMGALVYGGIGGLMGAAGGKPL